MGAQILNHLWQSTAFALACALVTLNMRRNRAHVRYALWIAASLKFLIPFAALNALGRTLGHKLLPATAGPMTLIVEFVRQPLSRTVDQTATRIPLLLHSTSSSNVSMPTVLAAIWAVGAIALCVRWAVRWRSLASVANGAPVIVEGREIEILRRLEQSHARRPIPMLVSDGPLEPGVFGLIAPRLLWPRGISAQLDDSQIEAILAHELSHAGRYDNLIAAVQMIVQAAFWFHPLVWWIGARLVEERERACDEDVLGFGSEPAVYAESILRTCRFSIESPLACMAGVTGADLKRRVEMIMNHRGCDSLGAAKRTGLAVLACTAIVGPVAIGVANAPRLHAQTPGGPKLLTFDVASVKPSDGKDATRVALMMQPGGRLQATNVPLGLLVRFAYQLQDSQIIGLPDWKDSNGFDINAKADDAALPAQPGVVGPFQPGVVGPFQQMTQALLADRFKLVAHLEKREMPIYALVVARSGKLGPSLRPSTVDCAAVAAERARGGMLPPRPGERLQCAFRIGPGQMTGGGLPLSQLAASLSNFAGRLVVDRTGITGNFDLDLKYSPNPMMMAKILGAAKPDVLDAPTAGDGTTLFTALQEQLGLKLEPSRGQADVLVVDSVERPSPD